MNPTVAIGETPFAVIVSCVALISLISSGIAVYVSNTASKIVLQFKLDISQFHVNFMKELRELDDRYVRRKDFDKDTATASREENGYRVSTREKIKDIEIELEREGGTVYVTLKEILKLMQEAKEAK